jgi:chromosome partitioning protein
MEMAPLLSTLCCLKVDENKSMQKALMDLMRQIFGNAMIRTPLKD